MAATVRESDGLPEVRQNMEAMLTELNPVMGYQGGEDNAKPNLEREVYCTGASLAFPAQEEGFQETIRKTIDTDNLDRSPRRTPMSPASC
jgi:hypothetical protein